MKNMHNKYIIATIKSWNMDAAKNFATRKPKGSIVVITDKKDLYYDRIKKLNPRFIFFPHWSWIIPRQIYDNFECVVFHMTDLPFGRGGSPLQNLIARGIKKTKISAIRVVKTLDAGPVYLKRGLSLEGSAEEIYRRASRIVFNTMIPYIVRNEPVPLPQRGKVVLFKRRQPKESRIPCSAALDKIYDHIRMLDAESYPKAFIETTGLRFEFTDVEKKGGFLEAKVKIMKGR